jgi:hypothetical protein
MLGTFALVIFLAAFSLTLAIALTQSLVQDNGVSRGTVYFIAVIVTIALAALAGLGLNIPNQSSQETTIRTLAIILPSTLLGVRLALGRRIITH